MLFIDCISPRKLKQVMDQLKFTNVSYYTCDHEAGGGGTESVPGEAAVVPVLCLPAPHLDRAVQRTVVQGSRAHQHAVPAAPALARHQHPPRPQHLPVPPELHTGAGQSPHQAGQAGPPSPLPAPATAHLGTWLVCMVI